MIPAELAPAFDGVIPSHIATLSGDGIPNVTAISQVFRVDERHIALSHQFFSKTKRNLSENPHAVVQVIHPRTFHMWLLDVRFVRSESEGPVFEAMAMQLEAIASMQGMQDVFRLRAADVFEVLALREITSS